VRSEPVDVDIDLVEANQVGILAARVRWSRQASISQQAPGASIDILARTLP
jgi:hypothetical protein